MSVIKFSTSPAFTSWLSVGCGGCGLLRGRLPLNTLAETLSFPLGVIVYLHLDDWVFAGFSASNRPLAWTISFDLTSNQVGLPAELKHINKRRKRN